MENWPESLTRAFGNCGYNSERACDVDGGWAAASGPCCSCRAEFRLAAASFISSVCCINCASSSLELVSRESRFTTDNACPYAESQNTPASAKNMCPDASSRGAKDKATPHINRMPNAADSRKQKILDEILPRPSTAMAGKRNEKARFILTWNKPLAPADSMVIAVGGRRPGRGFRKHNLPAWQFLS